MPPVTEKADRLLRRPQGYGSKKEADKKSDDGCIGYGLELPKMDGTVVPTYWWKQGPFETHLPCGIGKPSILTLRHLDVPGS